MLLVDDDHLVLAATKRMLQRTGCRVLSASSGEEAIELFAKHASEIDLLVTDSIMPGASGLDVYRTIAQHERLPVLFCSGYSHESFEDGFFDETDRDWLQKPVLRSVLLKKMSTLLASRS